MNLTLRIWRQKNTNTAGQFVSYQVKDVTPDMSFLEMLDVLNEDLIARGEEPVVFEHDCREGICGSCGFLINGRAHGPRRGTTVCQLYMRFFQDGDSLTLEPWRARAFPVVKDLMVDRSAFDRIIEFIAELNRDLIRAAFRPRREPLAVVGAPQHPAHEDLANEWHDRVASS